jgi:LPXTG-site transpeptidase (sortase) family protein
VLGGLLIVLGLLLSLVITFNGLLDAQRNTPPVSVILSSPPFTRLGPTESEGSLPTSSSAPVWIPDRISFPAIRLDTPVKSALLTGVEVQGQTYEQWDAPRSFAAGWQTTSAPLGVVGNTVFIGHNNAYGEVFAHLADLEVGDLILVYSGDKEFAYAIVQKLILPELYQPIEVRLENAQWIAPTQDERLTLVTCWPQDSNANRLIIVATPFNPGNIGDRKITPRFTSHPPISINTPGGLNPDHAQFVTDVTILDGTQFAPGTKFTKIWRIRNVGETTWTQQYVLEYTVGDLMALTRQIFFPNNVAPGKTVDLAIEIVAPESPGDHTSLFQFRNAQGVPFGVGPLFNDGIYIRITVIADLPAIP